MKKHWLSIILFLIFAGFVCTRLIPKQETKDSLESKPKASPDSIAKVPVAPSGSPEQTPPTLVDCKDQNCTFVDEKGLDLNAKQENPQDEPEEDLKDAFSERLKKLCAEGSTNDCIALAKYAQENGRRKLAIKYFEMGCKAPLISIRSCVGAGELYTDAEHQLAQELCNSSRQLELCLSTAAFYRNQGKLEVAKQYTQKACTKGISEACIAQGHFMNSDELNQAKSTCEAGNTTSCLYAVGNLNLNEPSPKLSSTEREQLQREADAKTQEYLQIACKGGEDIACVYIGQSKPSSDRNDLKTRCLQKGERSSCLTFIGMEVESENGSDDQSLKSAMRKACELGSLRVCNAMKN